MSDRHSVHRRNFLKFVGAAPTTVMLSSGIGLTKAYAADRTLTIAIPNNPVTIDPINQPSHDAMVLGQTVFENLIEVDVDGNMAPQLATSMPKISGDSKVYTFDLRDDVMFQNGQKMTAEDVKYSFDYMLNPDNKALRRPQFALINRVDIESPTQVRFEFSRPYVQWLFFLSKYMGIFPKDSREKNGPNFFKTGPVGVGTGPGIFEEWRPNDYVSFKRNPNYRKKDVPGWDRLVVRIIEDDATRIAYLMSGQADIISAAPPRDFVRLKQVKGIQGDSKPTLGGWFSILTNLKRPPFDDVNFRRAIAHAVDRKEIATQVYQGLVDPSAVPASPKAWWYNKAADDSLQFDLTKAKEYLAKSKYPNGASFELTMPSEPYLLDVKDAAIVLQSQLAKIGVKVTLRAQEFSAARQAVFDGTRDAGLFVTMSPGEPTYLVQIVLTDGYSMSKATNYNDPELLKLLAEANAEPDDNKAIPIYHRMQDKLAEDCPHIWLGFVHASNLWRDRVSGFKVNQGLTMRVANVKVT